MIAYALVASWSCLVVYNCLCAHVADHINATMAQLAPEPCVGRLGEPGQEGDGAEEDSESGFDEMEQARGEYGIQDVEGVVRHSEGCGDAGTEDHAALAEPDGISSFGTMEGCSS